MLGAREVRIQLTIRDERDEARDSQAEYASRQHGLRCGHAHHDESRGGVYVWIR